MISINVFYVLVVILFQNGVICRVCDAVRLGAATELASEATSEKRKGSLFMLESSVIYIYTFLTYTYRFNFHIFKLYIYKYFNYLLRLYLQKYHIGNFRNQNCRPAWDSVLMRLIFSLENILLIDLAFNTVILFIL